MAPGRVLYYWINVKALCHYIMNMGQFKKIYILIYLFYRDLECNISIFRHYMFRAASNFFFFRSLINLLIIFLINRSAVSSRKCQKMVKNVHYSVQQSAGWRLQMSCLVQKIFSLRSQRVNETRNIFTFMKATVVLLL